MDEYQVRTWQGWHHHMALSLMALWFLIGETHRGQQWTPALTLPQVRYGLSLLLLEVFCTPGIDSICRQVHRQLLRNELARFYHYRTRKGFDHGVGHSLLVLCDAKAPHGKKWNDFKALENYLFIVSISLS